jgi:hypothetical protein
MTPPKTATAAHFCIVSQPRENPAGGNWRGSRYSEDATKWNTMTIDLQNLQVKLKSGVDRALQRLSISSGLAQSTHAP